MNLLSIIAGTGFLLLIFTCKGEAQQTDLPQSVTVMVGEDVVLPCFLKPPKDATKMTVEWGRPDLKPRFVFVNLDGKEYSADQNEAFRGRSSMIPENLKNGDVSLKLSDVRISDSGRYRCYLPREKKEYFTELVVVHLQLKCSASSPGISLSGLDVSSSGVMLDCSAAGWYPEPEMFWLDGDGNIMSPGAAEKSTDPDGVYTVSSRVTVEKRNNNNFTCRVQQRDINQSRETHIHVPDGFFVPQPDCNSFNIFAVILGLMILIGAAAFIWKWRKTEISKKKLKEEVNEEKKQLMTKEKENLSEKKSELEEERKLKNNLKKRRHFLHDVRYFFSN
uniref:Ig-like domain-containing protein n=1 Tax=Poecilia formosa TaxID=48698 RepID=A0A087X336_POEFO